MNRPLELTTPTNGFALSAYWLSLILGMSYLTPLNSSPAIREAFGGPFFLYGLAASMTLSGLVGLVASAASLHFPDRAEEWLTRHCQARWRRLPKAMRSEQYAAAGVAFVFGIYTFALFRPDVKEVLPTLEAGELLMVIRQTFTTKLFAVTTLLGGIARFLQIWWEMRRWHQAQTRPKQARRPLANPDH